MNDREFRSGQRCQIIGDVWAMNGDAMEQIPQGVLCTVECKHRNSDKYRCFVGPIAGDCIYFDARGDDLCAVSQRATA